MEFTKKFFIFLISSIIFYAIFLIVSDLSKLSEHIINFKIEYLPLIVSLVSAGWLALYLRWILLLKNLKYSFPHKQNFSIFLSGFALSVTPGKIGELLKSQLLKEKFDLPRKISVPVILIERFYNAIGIVIISIFGILVFNFSGIIILITACLLILIFFILRSEKLFNTLIQKFSKIKYLSKFSNSFLDSYDVIKKSTQPRIFIISSTLSSIYWIFESIAVYFVLRSFGIDLLSIFDVIPTYATSIILGVASLIPGGLGVSESTLIGLLSLQGLTISTAASLTIFIRLLTLWYAVFIGFIALKISGAFSLNNSN